MISFIISHLNCTYHYDSYYKTNNDSSSLHEVSCTNQEETKNIPIHSYAV